MRQLENCPVCHSAAISYDYCAPTTRAELDKRLVRVRCSDCTHGFMNPSPPGKNSRRTTQVATTPTIPATVLSRMTSDPSNVLTEGKLGTSSTNGKRLFGCRLRRWILLRVAMKLGAQVKVWNQASTAPQKARKSGINVFNGRLSSTPLLGLNNRSMSLPRIT